MCHVYANPEANPYQSISVALYQMSVALPGNGVEQYYNTGIIIDYQLKIPLHFSSTVKTNPVNITSIFLHMVSLSSTETNRQQS